MEHLLAKDHTGKGSWMLIIGCPWDAQHHLRDFATGVTGPSFATCASCEYQTGTNLEVRDPEHDWSSDAFPERLSCGFNKSRPPLRLVKG